MNRIATHILVLVCLFAVAPALGQTVHTYYFSKDYKLLKSEKSAAYKAEVTTVNPEITGSVDVSVSNISGKLLQKYSYADIATGLRRDSLILYYPFSGIQRYVIYNKKGEVAKDEQLLEDGKKNVITRYEGKAIIEYLHFYYDNGALHNITKMVRGTFIDSSTTYYQNGAKRSIATYFTNGLVKTMITYNQDGTSERQVIYNEKGDVISELNSIPGTGTPASNKADFDIKKQITEFKGGNQSLYQHLGSQLEYPRDARDNNITGTTYIKFTVSPSGVVSNASIYLPVFPVLDFEALRVVSSIPDWIIGKQADVQKDVFYRLPVKFSIQ